VDVPLRVPPWSANTKRTLSGDGRSVLHSLGVNGAWKIKKHQTTAPVGQDPNHQQPEERGLSDKKASHEMFGGREGWEGEKRLNTLDVARLLTGGIVTGSRVIGKDKRGKALAARSGFLKKKPEKFVRTMHET